MTHRTNLQYADRTIPVMPSEHIRAENKTWSENKTALRPQTFHIISGDVHDHLNEKERHACNRATD